MMPKLIPLKELFEPIYGVNLELIHLEECNKNDDESIRFVSRTENNNGISAYVKKIIDIVPNPAHTISIAVSGSVLSSFYQDDEYYSGRDLYYLVPKIKMSKEEMIFYAFCIKANKYKYNYGRAANRTLRDIPIPAEMPADFRKISLNKIPIPSSQRLLNKDIELKIENWKSFQLNDLFIVQSGKGGNIYNLNIGTQYPYISSTSKNNGVIELVDAEESELHKGNTITVNRTGSVGEAFFQPFPFVASRDRVRVLIPKFTMNKYIGLFLSSIIRLEKYRFNYGRTWGTNRIKESKINLPTDKNGVPDFEFMENYIKSLPYSKNL